MSEPIGGRPQAVLLDMDGLLIDSERVLLDCWQAATADMRLDVDQAFWLSMVGLHERTCNEMLRERLGDRDAAALRERCHALYGVRVEAGLPLKPGVHELLDLLDRHATPRALVTSTRRDRAVQKLETTGLRPRFGTIVTGSDIEHPKPAPDIYLLAAQQLGVEPSRCVVLEDSAPGVQAALAAGATPIQVPDLVEPGAGGAAPRHRVVRSLHEARLLIEAAFAGSG